MKEYLMHHDPERWVDSDMTKDEYLLIAKYFGQMFLVVLSIIISLIVVL